jgi:DNA-binding LacI/PurR family transcriptional regulator
VPGQISVIGVDDIPQAEIMRLTTVATPTDEAGRAAVEMLLAHEPPGRRGEPAPADGPAPRQTLPTHLVVRASTGPAPKRSRGRANDRNRRAGRDEPVAVE